MPAYHRHKSTPADRLSPGENIAAVTPSNTDDLPFVAKKIYVGVAGDVCVDTVGGDLAIIHKNAPAGSYIEGLITRVRAAGTTATNLLAMGDGAYNQPLFDAAAGVLPPWLSFARATTGTYFDANGVLQTAAINAPRFDFLSGAAGLLDEPQATNLALQSDTFSGSVFNLSVSAAGVPIPSGATGGAKLSETAVTDTHFTFRSVSISAGVVTVFNILKAAERTWAWCGAYCGGTPSGAFFDLQNGVVGSRHGSEVSSHGMRGLGNGWWLCWLTGAKPAGSLIYSVSPAPGNGGAMPSYLGVAGSGILAAGRQVEVGSSYTSYIPTTTAAVTRSADIATLAVEYRTLPARIDATDLATGVRAWTHFPTGIGATLPVGLIHRVEFL